MSRTGSNDAYAWTGHGSGGLGSTADGRNQLATVGAASVTHDARGNMVSDGRGFAFGYSSENRLISETRPSYGSTVRFEYDPLGRHSAYDPSGRYPRWFLYDGHDLIGEYNPLSTRSSATCTARTGTSSFCGRTAPTATGGTPTSADRSSRAPRHSGSLAGLFRRR